MEDWLKCQISSLVKYRQNQNQKNKNIRLSNWAKESRLDTKYLYTVFFYMSRLEVYYS